MPEDYIRFLLADMPSAFLNRVRKQRHLRPPVWKESASFMHFVTYDLEDIEKAFGERSGVQLLLRKSYRGNKKVANNANEHAGKTDL